MAIMQRQSLFQLPLFPVLLVFFELGAYLSNDLYLPALPQISADFNASTSLTQMTLTAWFLGGTSLFLLLGPISDRFGRRPIILSGALLFALSTIGCASASSIAFLVVARFFQGISICSIGSAGYAAIHELYDQHTAIQFIALMGVITLMAPALGPLIGAILLEWITWRSLFWFLSLWGFLSCFFLWRWMPESLPQDKRHPLVWRVTLKQYGAILRNRSFVVYSLLFCIPIMGPMAWLTAGPFMVMEQWHYSSVMFGVIQMIVFSALILGAYMVKPLMFHLGIVPLMTLSTRIMLASGVLAIIGSGFFPKYLFALVLPLTLFVFGTALMFSPAQRFAIESSDDPMGVRMAMFSSFCSFFSFLGSFLASSTYNGTLLWLAVLLFVAGMIILPLQSWQKAKTSF